MVRSTPTEPLPRHFPRDVVRDLLGITRALYRAERAKPNPDRAHLDRLVVIGGQYRLALDLAKHGPDTMGGRAALSWAEKATTALGDLVQESELIAEAVRATAGKLRGGRR
jgi:hypothetical protein